MTFVFKWIAFISVKVGGKQWDLFFSVGFGKNLGGKNLKGKKSGRHFSIRQIVQAPHSDISYLKLGAGHLQTRDSLGTVRFT